jgi:hypothetical protein
MTRTRSSLGRFLVVWAGQLVSFTGSAASAFALGLWVYEQTGSTTAFALSYAATSLPALVAHPFAGVLVDRYDRRTVMLLSDGSGAVIAAGLAALLLCKSLAVWHVFAAIAVAAVAMAFQQLGFETATTQLAPVGQQRRALGLTQLAYAVSQLLAPILGTAVVKLVGLGGVVSLNLASFVVGMAGVAFVRFPPLAATSDDARRGSAMTHAWSGLRFTGQRPGLVALLVLIGCSNVVVGSVTVLITPLVLAFGTAKLLGTVFTMGGVGVVLGGAAAASWGGPRSALAGVVGALALSGVVLIGAGLAPSIATFSAAMFLFAFTLPILQACAQSIWQRKVPAGMQGRVFGLRRLSGQLTLTIGYLAAGPLAEAVFEPALAAGGRLAGTAGRLVGTGPGHGMCLLLVILGVVRGFVIPALLFYRPLRRVELDVPDAIVPDALAQETAA